MGSWCWFVLFLLIPCVSHQASANNKYCAFEIDGEAKYYICQRNENCCSIGCCVNLAFHFYQLWYYWLLIIFMFMVCSGGGWWYRFCRGSSSTATTTPGTVSRYTHNHHHHHHQSQQHPSTSSHLQRSLRPPHHQFHDRHCHHHHHHPQHRGARIVHRPSCGERSSSMFYLQRILKSPSVIQSRQLPPSYSTMFMNLLTTGSSNGGAVAGGAEEATTSADRPTATTTVCPYYQLYGPPPSYDTVIQLTTEGGVMTSCIVQPQEGGDVELRDIVAAEEIIEEVVISEPGSVQVLGEIAKATQQQKEEDDDADDEVADAVVDAEMPLISVKKCNSGSTEPTDSANCEGVVVVSSTTSRRTREDEDEDDDVVAGTGTWRSCEEVPSTSSTYRDNQET